MKKSKSDMSEWELKDYEAGEETGKAFMQYVNSLGRQSDGFVDTVCWDHPTLQQSAMKVFMKCIKEWSEKDRFIDDRNKATVKLCKKIMEAVGDDCGLPLI